MFVRGFKEQFDVWSGWHFFGPYVLADFVGWFWAGVAVVTWEAIDFIYALIFKRYCSARMKKMDPMKTFIPERDLTVMDKIISNVGRVLDQRGASWADLVLGGVAVLIWCWRHGLI